METETYGILGMSAITILLLWYIMRLRSKNIAASRDENEPNIAGKDVLEGLAKNPEQFDEPDEQTLEMLGDLLQETAESQGLTYKD